MQTDPIVIVEALRTPVGAIGGALSRMKATELGAVVLRALLNMTGIDKESISEVILGCVLQAGLGQSPARQVIVQSGISKTINAFTVNKVCGSGMRSIIVAKDQLLDEKEGVYIAGGIESMSRAPHLLIGARGAKNKLNPALLKKEYVMDHIYVDGIEDAYNPGILMGIFAEDTADAYQLTRDAQEAYALTSLERARHAQREGFFDREIVPILLSVGGDTVEIERDECVDRANPEKIPLLKPAFKEGGTITAATASALADGAAALLLMRQSRAEALGLKPRARIVANARAAKESKFFTIAPVDAIRGVVAKAGWTLKSVDLFEINEAFSVVPMAAMKILGLPHEKVNVNGGAVVMGHPLGMSSARIVTTLINALEQRSLKRGVAAVCIGGGEGLSIAIEII